MQAPGVQNLWIYRPERTPVEIRKRNNVHVIDAVRPDVPVHVYAHGFWCSQHMWRHITPAFEGKCRQVLFDYVGCGQSDLAAFDPVKYASLASVGKGLQDHTGQTYRKLKDGDQANGICRRSLQLARGRFAMLDDGKGFSLVPWKPVMEMRLGKTLTATVRGGSVSWDFGMRRGPSIA